MMKRIKNASGFTLIELMIALLVTGIITAAGFSFYVQMHNSTLTQEEISEMQHSSRVSLEEMAKTLRMAGYKTDGYQPYRINGESLYVFLSITKPVDTVLYYLANYADGELISPDSIGTKFRPRKLMVKYNNGTPEVYADNISGIRYRVINPTTVEINLTVQTMRSDEAYADTQGYRFHTESEQVKLRNVII
jgi:prepilin-type N-terminal cleavage/methylation domain-containing protein